MSSRLKRLICACFMLVSCSFGVAESKTVLPPHLSVATNTQYRALLANPGFAKMARTSVNHMTTRFTGDLKLLLDALKLSDPLQVNIDYSYTLNKKARAVIVQKKTAGGVMQPLDSLTGIDWNPNWAASNNQLNTWVVVNPYEVSLCAGPDWNGILCAVEREGGPVERTLQRIR